MNDSTVGVIVAIICIIGFSFISVMFTYEVLNRSWEHEAINVGYAEYYIDKDFCKQWRWFEKIELERKIIELFCERNEKSLAEKPVSEPGEPI